MEKTTEKNPVEEELYIEPNPTEEEVEEQIRVIEMVNNAMEEAEKIAKQTIIHKWLETENGTVCLWIVRDRFCKDNRMWEWKLEYMSYMRWW